MVDLTTYWVMAQVVSKIFVALNGSSIAEFHQNRPTTGAPGGVQAITMKEMDGSGNYLDTWFLAVDPTLGVIEYQDNFADGHQAIYAPGYYGRWGTSSMKVGDTLSYQLHLSNVQDATGWGWQTVTLTSMQTMTVPVGTYDNVARLDWTQTWCANASCTSTTVYKGTYYLAQGIGMIRMEWTQPAGGPYVLSAIVTTNQ